MPNGSKFHDLKVIGENKFANNSDYYQYTLTLRDKY
jgi:hypothetical protein